MDNQIYRIMNLKNADTTYTTVKQKAIDAVLVGHQVQIADVEFRPFRVFLTTSEDMKTKE